MNVTTEEIYLLAKKLYESYEIMKKVDDHTAQQLLIMASNVLDLVDNTRFDTEESKEIDELVEELDD